VPPVVPDGVYSNSLHRMTLGGRKTLRGGTGFVSPGSGLAREGTQDFPKPLAYCHRAVTPRV